MLLRAVNLGSHHKVPMAEWRTRLAALGTDVRTHLQSGQAVLDTDLPPDALAQAVHDDLLAWKGVDTPVLVRDGAALDAVVAGCPWPDVAAADPTKVHVAFTDEPARGWWHDDPDRWLPERAQDGPGVVYLLFPDGAGRARMPTAGKPGQRATARNWRTVLAVQALLNRVVDKP